MIELLSPKGESSSKYIMYIVDIFIRYCLLLYIR